MIETDITAVSDPVVRFFAYARERHSVYLRRAAGQNPPWTVDTILRWSKFTNVFRELDRTTAWFKRHVRDPLKQSPEVLPATVIFRWFNRVTTGEALFCQLHPGPVEAVPSLFEMLRASRTAFECFLATGDVDWLRRSIKQVCAPGPYVTGAYTINTLSAGLGKTKLEGVLDLIRQWFELHQNWRAVAETMISGRGGCPLTLETFCRWARSPCLGEFMTYEVACDLRHTALLARAPDVMTWANLGPGARRGLNRIFRGLSGKEADRAIPGGAEAALEEMRALWDFSTQMKYWPLQSSDWPSWELREVEHTLCEYDKYMRVAEGTGRPRGRAPR